MTPKQKRLAAANDAYQVWLAIPPAETGTDRELAAWADYLNALVAVDGPRIVKVAR